MWRKLSRLILLAGLLTTPLAARAQPVDVAPADRAAIQQVITTQVEAFRRDDGDSAFRQATPELQTMFGDAQTFMSLVRRAYQPVYRPKTYNFGDTDALDGGGIEQELAVIGPDGLPHVAVYTMEREPDGTWKIAGCRLIERPAINS